MTAAAVDGLLDVAPAPTLASVARRIGWRGVTDGVVPVALFLALDAAHSLVLGMAAATTWTVLLSLWRVATGRRTGVLIWVATGYALLRGAAGVLTGSAVVFFGPGIAQTALIGLLFLLSAAVRRPVVARIADVVYPFSPVVKEHPAYRRVFTRLTLLWGGWLVVRAGLDVWLLLTVDPSVFVLVRSSFGLPVLVGLFVLSLRYPRRAFRREPDLRPWVDAAEAARGRPVAPAV